MHEWFTIQTTIMRSKQKQ